MGQMHRIKQAKLAAMAAGQPAAPDTPARSDPARQAADLMLIQLTEHRKQLKALQSLEKKIALKAEILPEYADWVRGLLANADALPAGQPNDVLTTLMIWSIDIGDFGDALKIAEVVLAKHIPLPAQFDRTAAVLIAEQVAEAALKAVKNGNDFDRSILQSFHDLVDGEDMPDQVRAKLFKADAQLCDRAATALAGEGGTNADGPAGEFHALLTRGLASAQRAMELDDKAGMVTLIKKFTRELKNLDTAAEAAAAKT